MLRDSDIQQIKAIADHVESLFKTLSNDEIGKVESTLRQEIKHQAAIARAKCAERENGQDRFER